MGALFGGQSAPTYTPPPPPPPAAAPATLANSQVQAGGASSKAKAAAGALASGTNPTGSAGLTEPPQTGKVALLGQTGS